MPFPAPQPLPRRNHGCRLDTDMTLWGRRALVLQNELLRITVLPDKGAEIVEFLYKPLDVDFMWANPSGPRPLETNLPVENPKRAFGDHYLGGWQELFPHGSVPVNVHGADMPMHGEVWALPWEVRVEEDRPECVSVTLRVRCRLSPFVLERTMSLRSGSPVMEMIETAHNVSSRTCDLMWGHHPAFGAPFLSEDVTIYAPAKTVRVDLEHATSFPVGQTQDGKRRDFSRMPARGKSSGGMLYLEDLKSGWYALMNRKQKVGFGMQWDAKLFPKVWIWQDGGRGRTAPWHGRSYAMAVEPFTHLPFARERGERMVKIKGRGRLSTRMLALAIPGGGAVKHIDTKGRVK